MANLDKISLVWVQRVFNRNIGSRVDDGMNSDSYDICEKPALLLTTPDFSFILQYVSIVLF